MSIEIKNFWNCVEVARLLRPKCETDTMLRRALLIAKNEAISIPYESLLEIFKCSYDTIEVIAELFSFALTADAKISPDDVDMIKNEIYKIKLRMDDPSDELSKSCYNSRIQTVLYKLKNMGVID